MLGLLDRHTAPLPGAGIHNSPKPSPPPPGPIVGCREGCPALEGFLGASHNGAEHREEAAVRVRDVMSSPVVTVPPGMRLKEVAGLLVGRGVGAVPVVDDGDLVGIVSDADPTQAVAGWPCCWPAACPWSWTSGWARGDRDDPLSRASGSRCGAAGRLHRGRAAGQGHRRQDRVEAVSPPRHWPPAAGGGALERRTRCAHAMA
jgi:hypothetical protein